MIVWSLQNVVVQKRLFSFSVFTDWSICWNAEVFDIKKRLVMDNRQTGVWLFFVLVKDKVLQHITWIAHKHIHILILFFLADWIFPECYVHRLQIQHYLRNAIKIWMRWWTLGWILHFNCYVSSTMLNINNYFYICSEFFPITISRVYF